MIPVKSFPGMGGGRDKGEWWRGWIQVWYSWYIVRTFVNATMYPHSAQQFKKEKKRILKMKTEIKKSYKHCLKYF
jgi:hypothetical protein